MCGFPGDSKHSGFTLVEIIVAAAVLSVFFIGLFSLYRMGSTMFITGSWKLNKQKEAERFLAVLRERLEQATPASVISSDEVINQRISIYALPNGTGVDASSLRRLILFPLCKPNMVINDQPGLIMAHTLTLRPRADSPLGDLVLYGTGRPGEDLINGENADFIAEINAAATSGDFTGQPSQFGLGGNRMFQTVLEEVASATIIWEVASGTVGADTGDVSGQTLGIEIVMQNAKHPETIVTQRVRARIDDGTPIKIRSLNEL